MNIDNHMIREGPSDNYVEVEPEVELFKCEFCSKKVEEVFEFVECKICQECLDGENEYDNS